MVIMRRGLYVLLVTVFMAATVSPTSIEADEALSDWLKAKPQVSDKYEYLDTLPHSINGNRDCVKQRVITRPSKVLPYWPHIQHEESHDSCVVNTGYGAVSQSGYLQTPGESTFGRIVHSWGGSLTLLPVPRSANGIYIEPNPSNGVKLSLIRDLLSNITGATLANGEILYTVKAEAPVVRLVGSNGQPLGVQLDSVSFSSSGKWMIADIPFVGMSRIDTSSFNVRTFDTGFSYNIGTAPGVQSAVTNSGRYTAVSSAGFTRFRLYDLENCPTATSCKYVDLQSFFAKEAPGFISGLRLRFASDYALRMFMVRQVGASKKVYRQVLRANGHQVTSFGYLGLGDSFASGEGAYQYKALTDTGLNKCHLSLRSYPYLIADELGINEAESVACTGAVINDVRDESSKYPENAQARGKPDQNFNKEIYENFLPGYRPQFDFLAFHEPEALTLSISGNDIGFRAKIMACLMPGTCYDSYEHRFEAAQEVNNQFDRLVGLYTDIKEQMLGKKVYIIGYPEIAMDNGNCGNNVRLDNEEVRFSNQLVRHLNKIIKSAAEKTGLFYVDVERAFYEHRLCETTGSNTAVNGITAGDDNIDLPFTDFGGPIGNESFHPNDLGHQKLKEAILKQTNNFTAPMPSPNPTASPSKIMDTMELLKDTSRSGRTTNTVIYTDDLLESEVIIPGEEMRGQLPQTESGFKPGSTVQVWMHSEPVKLGDFTADTSGGLEFTAQIPADTAYGFHTIHLYGTSLTGKPLDIQKVFYVAAPATVPDEPAETPTPTPQTNDQPTAGTDPIPVPEDDNSNLITQPETASAPPRQQIAYAAGAYSTPSSSISVNTGQVAGASDTTAPPEATTASYASQSYLFQFITGAAILTLLTCFLTLKKR